MVCQSVQNRKGGVEKGLVTRDQEAIATGGAPTSTKKEKKISLLPAFLLPLAGPQLETSWQGSLGSVACSSPLPPSPKAWS